MQLGRKPHVFVSYIREDREAVERLCAEFKRNGVEVWLDREKIRPGERWQIAIRRAIEEGAFFIACFSPAYGNRSKSYMNVELTIAVEQLRSRPADRAWFIPILLEGGAVPDRPIGGGETLRDIQWVDLSEDWDDGLRRVLKVLLPEYSKPFPEPSPRKDLVRVFLITDIVGSTSLNLRHGDEVFRGIMLKVMDSQQAAVAKHGGELINRTGDGMTAAFDSALNAIACALAIQRDTDRSESPEEVKSRIGLSAGSILTDHGVIVTSTLKLAVRICSLAEGGEILMSESVHKMADVEGLHLRERGLVALKGFSEPIRIYEVIPQFLAPVHLR